MKASRAIGAMGIGGLLCGIGYLAAAGSPAGYTIYQTERMTVQQGPLSPRTLNDTVVSSIVKARRSDGSTAEYTRHVRVDDKDVLFDDSTVVDLRNCKIVHVFEFLRGKSSYPLTDFDIQRRLAAAGKPSTDCQYAENGRLIYATPTPSLGHENVLGIDSVLFVKPAQGNEVNRVWLAPSLACAMVKSEYLTYDSSGQLVKKVVHEPDRIVIGEPAEALFNPPGDELKPSELYYRRMKAFGTSPSDKVLSELAQQDQDYLQARTKMKQP